MKTLDFSLAVRTKKKEFDEEPILIDKEYIERHIMYYQILNIDLDHAIAQLIGSAVKAMTTNVKLLDTKKTHI